jgi:hypothetical protein
MAQITTKGAAVKIWKDLGITSCTMEFSCGGDSMNDYSFTFNKGSKKVEGDELNDFFDDEVFRNVDFYVNSDGHYIGEAGEVHIELDDESDDEEEHTFTYSKSARSEFSETFSSYGQVKLTKKESEFIKENVLNINGGDGGFNINYKRDLILSDENEKLVKELENKIVDFVEDFDVEGGGDGEASDWYSFTTNDEDDDEIPTLKVDDEHLLLRVSREFYVYRDSE